MKLRYLVIGSLIGLLIGAVPAYAIIFTFGGGGGAAGADQNLFETIDAPSGTDPVADTTTDTLQILCDDGVTCIGSAAGDSIEWDVTLQTAGADADSATTQSDSGLEFVANELVLLRGCADNELLKWDETQDDWNCEADVDTDTQLTQEQVEDFAGALVTDGTGTHTDITITYQDATGDVDFVVDTLPNLTGTLDVDSGGTGATTLTDGGILLGSGTGAITALAVATNGQIPIGDGATDPVLATITPTTNQVNVTNGAGTITLSTPQDIHTAATPTFGTISPNATTDDLGSTTAEWDDIFLGDTGTVNFGLAQDVVLSRGAVDRLDIATGDSLRMVNGDIQIQGTGSNLEVDDQILMTTAGAAGDPSYSWNGDPDSGMYNPVADIVGLVAGGVDLFGVRESATDPDEVIVQGEAALRINEVADANTPTTSETVGNEVALFPEGPCFVIAYNDAGTITFLKIGLDGADTSWANNTTDPTTAC